MLWDRYFDTRDMDLRRLTADGRVPFTQLSLLRDTHLVPPNGGTEGLPSRQTPVEEEAEGVLTPLSRAIRVTAMFPI